MTKTFNEIANIMISRRQFTKGLLAASVVSYVGFTKSAKAEVVSQDLIVPEGYHYKPLISWGDPLFPGMPEFNPNKFTLEHQLKSFGYNNDYAAYIPLDGNKRGLLCINHEGAVSQLMFPDFFNRTKEQANIQMAAIGHSVVEVYDDNGNWKVNRKSKYNRRFNNYDTEFLMTGPAAGRVKGEVVGTATNCGGGVTPWGTVLSCEENINLIFSGDTPNDMKISAANCQYNWYLFHDRFNTNKAPDEPNKYGWVIEYDPLDPTSKPKKRTALGRMMHEASQPALTKDGRVVIYMGDDAEFEHVYKFISARPVIPNNKKANEDILDYGTLYVAQFKENGSVRWLAIPPEEILCTRSAAKKLGATPMDRPEGISLNPLNGKIYISLTHNSNRDEPNPANPRPQNHMGHILELIPDDHADLEHKFEVFLLGDQNMACPDTIKFDSTGRLWIASDGMEALFNVNEAVYYADTEGPNRGIAKKFLSLPTGAEPCTIEFSPDEKTMFLCVQHPGEGSDYTNPSTRWPDNKPDMPPRPTVVTVQKNDGKKILG